MAKIILKNPNFGVEGMFNCDKPYYMPVSKEIREYCGKYSLDLSSEIFDIYLTEDQVSFFKIRSKTIYLTTFLPFKIIYESCVNMECLDVFAISPCHDMDIKEDGTYKKPHFHLILRFITNVPFSKCLDTFHTTEMRKLGDNWYNEFHYLYHGTEACKREGKYLYNRSEIVSNDIAYCESRARPLPSVVTAKNIMFDIKNGLSPDELIDKYDFVYVHNIRNLYYAYNLQLSREHTISSTQVDTVYDLGDVLLIKFKSGRSEVIPKKSVINNGEVKNV